MIVSFKFYVMNFVGFVLIAIHISPHMYLKFFANFTHYISYSLLNIIDVIMCVSQSDQPNLQLLWVLVQNIFCVWECKGECLKILILGKLSLILVFWKNILSHTHAFYSLYSMLWGVFSKNQVIFVKNFVLPKFQLIQSIFRSIEITFKIFVSFCLFRSIEIDSRSIEKRG